ncbi:MAG: sulfatase [Thermoanaerobaculia bacterium]
MTFLAISAAACRDARESLPMVLVVVDTLRADHLGLYGYRRPTSPELDRWAQKGAVFENAYATSPWTLASFGSLYTGRLPERHRAGFKFGRRRFSSLDPAVPTLAELFAAEGHTTASIITNVYLGPTFGLDRGFETFVDLAGDATEPPQTADVVVDRALAWLAERRPDEPFLLSIHLLDPHLPYGAPPPERGRFTRGYAGALQLPFDRLGQVRSGKLRLTEADREFLAGAYDEEIAFVDRQLGRLFVGLDEAGLFERGLVFFTSDHGEEFLEHGGFEHGHAMFQEVLRIPMIVWGAGIDAGRLASPVSLIDILPTLAEAAGFHVPAGVEGTSLWGALARGEDLPPGRWVAAQWTLQGPQRQALVAWPLKAVLNLRTGRARLFHLVDDPAERRDLAATDRDRLQELLRDLRRILPDRRPSEGAVATLDERTEAQLRALGYLQ